MKRLIGALFVVALVAVTAGVVDAGDRFNPTDRQRPGRTYHVFRRTMPVVVQSAPTTAGDVIRSFSFEPGSKATPVSSGCCCKTNCGCNVADAPATDNVRSFSYEPEAVAVPVAVPATTRRFANRAAERLWRKQHPGVK
tara:strand:+ start:94629 stop:95045 length:417 start_codon:yes stop_codon:yes gene_type:complete